MASSQQLTLVQALQSAEQAMNARKFAEAQNILRQILAAIPNQPHALHLTGRIAIQAARPEVALECLDQAAKALDQHYIVQADRGNALLMLGRMAEAVEAYRKASALKPEDAGLHTNIGIALHELGRTDEALAAFRKAVEMNPNFANGYNNLGTVLGAVGNLDESIAAYEKSIALRPDWFESHTNLACVMRDAGRIPEAIAESRKALELNPKSVVTHSNLIVFMQYDPSATPQQVFEEHRRWNQLYAVPLKSQIKPHTNDRDPNRRLRIGYISADFREHSVSFFFEGLLAAHDRTQFEVFCYADRLRKTDAFSERLSRSANHWRNITGLSDERVVDMIRTDAIDILVDLAGHTSGGRLLVLARKPAPVQVSYLGYPNTTGLDTVDYYITDAHLDPPGQSEPYFSEQLVRLPDTFACYKPPESAPEVAPLPAQSNGFVTFASFNNFAKLNDQVFKTWSRILQQVPKSRMFIAAKGLQFDLMARHVRDAFKRFGITPDRLDLAGYVSQTEYLATHQKVDILLDPFPVNGHTITCHALWMGVPIISFIGTTHAGRLGTSVLNNVGLSELLADSVDAYIDKAVGLANDLPRLADLRATLRDRMARSPLMDGRRVAMNIENAYRTMWQRMTNSETRNPNQ